MRLMSYGEDALTLAAVTGGMPSLLTKLRDATDAEDALVLYRPSFGRRSGIEGRRRSEFGEFDAIIGTAQAIYLVEAKWSASAELRSGSIQLRPEQLRRHQVFRSYLQQWRAQNCNVWADFVPQGRPMLEEGFEGLTTPGEDTTLAKNLEYVLNLLMPLGEAVVDVLLGCSPGPFAGAISGPRGFEVIQHQVESVGGAGYVELWPTSRPIDGEARSGTEHGDRPLPSLRHHSRRSPLPSLVAHADWGADPRKRWLCVARLLSSGRYEVGVPELVGSTAGLIGHLREQSEGPVLVGFDFPIGVPAEYARSAGITSFKEALSAFGGGAWPDFFSLAEEPGEISLRRPFYPYRPGGTKRQHLIDGLGVSSYDDLIRRCEQSTDTRGQAASLFWTLGGQQVGRAAIIGWREVLQPALEDPEMDVALWPFDGDLAELLENHDVVVTETYPAEGCLHVGLPAPGRGWSKRSQDGRAARAAAILEWADRRDVVLPPDVSDQISDGFGPSKEAEDPFDAVIGLLSMIEVLMGGRSAGAPQTAAVRQIEGWILGQESQQVS